MAFNSKEFAWSDIQIVAQGRVITRIRGVKYGIKKEKEALYAGGENPFAIQSGNKTYEGEITLLQSEVEAFQEPLEATEDLTDVAPFNIVVSYVPKQGGSVITHTLESVEFTEDMREMSQGDKNQEITLPIVFLGRKATTN